MKIVVINSEECFEDKMLYYYWQPKMGLLKRGRKSCRGNRYIGTCIKGQPIYTISTQNVHQRLCSCVQIYIIVLTLESRCIPVVGGEVLVSRTQPNHKIKYMRFAIIHLYLLDYCRITEGYIGQCHGVICMILYIGGIRLNKQFS